MLTPTLSGSRRGWGGGRGVDGERRCVSLTSSPGASGTRPSFRAIGDILPRRRREKFYQIKEASFLDPRYSKVWSKARNDISWDLLGMQHLRPRP